MLTQMNDEPNNSLETRPADVRVADWKNRFLVSSKLTYVNHKNLKIGAGQITILTHQVLTI
jgi:hypothetical protein